MIRRLLLIPVLFLFAVSLQAKELVPVELRITESYLELHTGPSSEYRIEHVLLTGEKITIKKQHADWFYLQRDDKVFGWAPLKTLLDNRVDHVGMSFDEFLINLEGDLEFDLAFRTGFIEGDYLLGVEVAQWFDEDIRFSFNFNQVPGKISETLLMTLDMDYFFSRLWSMRPYVKLGFGQLVNTPSSEVVGGEETSSNVTRVGFGVFFAESKRIKFSAGFSLYQPDSDAYDDVLQEISIGMNYYF